MAGIRAGGAVRGQLGRRQVDRASSVQSACSVSFLATKTVCEMGAA